MTARYLVTQALVRQEEGGYANLVLDAELKKHSLEPRDRAFASAVFYAVLEHQLTLDYILGKFLSKKVEKLDPAVRAILRSGLAQVRYMSVPASAAVNEAVKLARAFKKSSASGLVNAVLRKAVAFDLEAALAAEAFPDEAARLMATASVSRPVAEFFLEHYPDEAYRLLCRTAANDDAATAIRINPLRTDRDRLYESLTEDCVEHATSGPLKHSMRVWFEGSPADTDAFHMGWFHVQGLTSQLAVFCLGAQPGETVVDLCAAPGGKTVSIAEDMRDMGTLYSCDVTPNRTSLIKKAVQRMGLTCVQVLCNDASKPNPKLQNADRILADVPCSGLGILEKKPDIRYKDLAGTAELVALQRQILENAAASLAPGGRLVYSTCTVNPEENERQIEAFLRRHPEFTVDVPPLLEAMKLRCGPYGALSIPTETHLDGFFICPMNKAR